MFKKKNINLLILPLIGNSLVDCSPREIVKASEVVSWKGVVADGETTCAVGIFPALSLMISVTWLYGLDSNSSFPTPASLDGIALSSLKGIFCLAVELNSSSVLLVTAETPKGKWKMCVVISQPAHPPLLETQTPS